MTRDEAVAIYWKNFEGTTNHGWFIDTLVDLGVLHVETTEDTVRIAAAERLIGMHVDVHNMEIGPQKIGRDGAFEILDILIKSGFRITRDAK